MKLTWRGWLAWGVLMLLVGVFLASAAEELQLSVGWTYNKNNRKRVLSPTTVQYDVAGNAVIENVQSIATNVGGEALILGDVTAPGFAWFHNLDPTNKVEIGSYDVNTNFVAFLELRAGEKMPAWLATAAPRALAYTNAVRLDYVIVDR